MEEEQAVEIKGSRSGRVMMGERGDEPEAPSRGGANGGPIEQWNCPQRRIGRGARDFWPRLLLLCVYYQNRRGAIGSEWPSHDKTSSRTALFSYRRSSSGSDLNFSQLNSPATLRNDATPPVRPRPEQGHRLGCRHSDGLNETIRMAVGEENSSAQIGAPCRRAWNGLEWE